MVKILIVNNDIDTMTLLKYGLEKHDYIAEFTGDPEKAFTLINKLNPDILLVDILWEDLVEKLKQDPGTKHIPLLLLSGYTKSRKNADSPADDVITKPFTFKKLQKKIEQLLATRSFHSKV